MSDSDIINFYNNYKSTHKILSPTRVFNKEILNYIYNRFDNNMNLDYKLVIRENLYRILNHIYEIPKCKTCDKELKFKFNDYTYGQFCSRRCSIIDHTPFRDVNIRNKIKQTNILKYGVDNVLKLKVIRDKAKQTKLERYNDINYNNKEKVKITCRNKYGVDYPSQNKEIRNKQIKTLFNRYGGYFNKEQVSKTIKERYSVDWYTQSQDIIKINSSVEVRNKQQETKRKNNTFNKSKPEDECYKLLCDKFGSNNIIRQYKSELYPFNCDFYVLNLNLYIECNFHWTHNDHLYNKNNIKDIIIKCKWKNKNTKFYDNAIKIWTKRDVIKYKTAKINNLNYLVFYNIKEFNDWYKNLNNGKENYTK